MEFVSERSGRLVHCSPAWEEFTQTAFRSVEGSTGAQITHPDDLARVAPYCFAQWSHARPMQCRVRIRAGGRWVSILCHNEPRFSPSGIFLGYRGFIAPTPEILPPAGFRLPANHRHSILES